MGRSAGSLEAVGGTVAIAGELFEEGGVAEVVLEDVGVFELVYVNG